MLFKFKDEKTVVIKIIRVCIFHAYLRTDLQVEILFKLDLRRWCQKVCLSLPELRNMKQHLSTILRGHFKGQNHQQKEQKCVNVLLNRWGKGPLSIACHLDITFFGFSWESGHWVNQIFPHLHVATCDPESVADVDSGVTGKF